MCLRRLKSYYNVRCYHETEQQTYKKKRKVKLKHLNKENY